ncbi:MAG: hypothetical protein QM765_09190 [Myxococcales bacterium]
MDGTRDRAALMAQTGENAIWLEAQLGALAEAAYLVDVGTAG